MVVIKNLTISSIPTKSGFAPTVVDSDGTVDADTTAEITGFLTTFFSLYPKASEQELSYYVKNQALQPIGKDYIFSELVNPVYRQVENGVSVSVSVIYLDSVTKAMQVSQFDLMVEKDGNWLITK